jgi:hypothetical protein
MLERLKKVWFWFVLEGLDALEAIYCTFQENLRQYYADLLALEVVYARS